MRRASQRRPSSRGQLEELERGEAEGLAPRQRTLLVQAGKGQLDELQRELKDYEALRKGTIPITPLAALDELPLALIRTRIARGWTQAKLAEQLDVPEQQVQRDEANAYRGASFERVRRVAAVLGLWLAGATRRGADALGRTYERRKDQRSRSTVREDARERIAGNKKRR